MSPILVTGATGNVGSRVVTELLARGVPVRAFVRDRERAAAVLPDEVELAVGDLDDAASVRAALAGADRVFLTSANGVREVEQECAVLDAADVPVVKLSVVGAQAGSPMPGRDWHGRIEEHLRRRAVPAVVLQANWFMSNLLMSADSIRQTGSLFAPAGGGKVAMIDPLDIAACAAATLTCDDHFGQTFVLTGPAAITYDEVASALGAATGRTITYVDIPEAAALRSFTEAGLPDWLVTHLMAAYALIRQGGFEQTTDSVRLLTGRQPRTFTEFAKDNAAAFAS